MKRLLVAISIILLLFALAGCDLLTFSTTATTMTTDATDTTVETTTESPATTATSDPRLVAIETEFETLSHQLPTGVIADCTLPTPANEAITVAYAADGIPIGMTLVYDEPALDTIVILTVTLTYGDVSVTRTYDVLFLRDLAAYDAYMTEIGFAEIDALLAEAMPDEIKCDFTLPELSYGDAELRITVETSRIYDGRFIFTFPFTDTAVRFTARVIYKGVTRYFDYDVVMKAFDTLARIPELHIWTNGNRTITSKEEYLSGIATLMTFDENNVATTVFANRSMQIRGRGNSTWYMPKKPYKIKFDDKTPMFTDYEAKDWVLLANYTDQSLIRNYLAYKLAASIGMEYTPSATFIDVYMNGEYIGNYMLTDQIEASPVRVNVEEDSSALDTGYLVEMDMKVYEGWDGAEGVGWFTVYGYPYALRSPHRDSFYYRQAQFDYIYDYITTVHVTLMNRRDYTAYIDEASFIDWFIVEEVFKNVDSGYSSVFMYKNKGGVLKMGPVWDFDLSASNPGHLDYTNRMPPGWYTSQQYKNVWFYYLMRYETFRLHLQQRWNELFETQVLGMLASVYPVSDAIARSRHLNFERWDVIGKNWDWYTSQEVYDAKTYEEQMKLLYAWLEARIAWMDAAINDPHFV